MSLARAGRSDIGRTGPWILGVTAVGLQMALAAYFLGLREAEHAHSARERTEAADLRAELVAVRKEAEAQRASTVQTVESLLGELKSDLGRSFERSAGLMVAPTLRLQGTLSEVERTLESERDERHTDLARMDAALFRIEKTVGATVHSSPSMEEKFRKIQTDADPSLFLVHCEFTYLTRNPGEPERKEAHTGTGAGTAFVVADGGYLVTNKHVVQPWKFDSELMGLVALGQAEILEGSVRVSAWPSGESCLDDWDELRFETSFENHDKRTLSVLGIAPDHLVKRSMEIAGTEVSYEVHALDNHDLAILRIEGLTAPALRLSKGTETVRKLDPVMALGFPRGHRGLETGRVETSPSLGTVRKVQDTIHITASIIPGNSGGPVFAENGEVVGIATRIYTETLGICLKIEHATALLDQVRGHNAVEIMASPR